MKKIEYNLKYIKKNLILKDLFYNLEKNVPDLDGRDTLIYNIVSSTVTKKDPEDESNFDNIKETLESFYSYLNKNTTLQKQLDEYQFYGTLLPKINSNFQRKIFWKMNDVSHSLIFSKLNKKFYYIKSMREFNYKQNKPKKKTKFSYVSAVSKKKLNEENFFKLVEKNNTGDEAKYLDGFRDLEILELRDFFNKFEGKLEMEDKYRFLYSPWLVW